MDRQAALGGDQVGHPGVVHRLEGVNAEDALSHRFFINVVDAVPGAAACLGVGRQEGQGLFPAGPQQGIQLGPDVSPQGRVGLFVDVRHLLADGPAHDIPHDAGGLGGRQVPGLRVDHKHFGPVRVGGRKGRIGHHPGAGAAAGQLDAGVQRTGEIVCNDQ